MIALSRNVFYQNIMKRGKTAQENFFSPYLTEEYPNWWYTVPMAVHSFLEEYDFDGKTVIPFVTHGTGGLASTIQDITADLPDSEILQPIGVYRPEVDNSETAVDAWLESLGF